MIPTEEQAKMLWEKYQLPDKKRRHVELVARAALLLAQQIDKVTKRQINKELLLAGALLHDIDKNAPKHPGERHPDAAVRILNEEGMEEVASLVKTHPVHAILDPAIAPRTIEQKLVFLADKMVKQDVIGVDGRFAQWKEERLPPRDIAIIARAYPRVKELEREIADLAGIKPREIVALLMALVPVS